MMQFQKRKVALTARSHGFACLGGLVTRPWICLPRPCADMDVVPMAVFWLPWPRAAMGLVAMAIPGDEIGCPAKGLVYI